MKYEAPSSTSAPIAFHHEQERQQHAHVRPELERRDIQVARPVAG
jgi:hypothetical protein